MSESTEYFSGQGRVYIGNRNSDGSRAPARWVFDASVLELEQSSESEDKKESWSGTRGLAATLKTGREMKVKLTLGQLNTDIAALAVDGKRVDIASGTATAEPIGAVTAGDVVALEYSAISALVLTDGTASALVLDTDYTANMDTGVITFLSTKAGVTAAYGYAAHSVVTAFNGENKDKYVLFDGMNTVDGAELKTVAEVHRVTFGPAATFGFIQESFGDLALEGRAKMDPVRQADPKFGPYARVKLITPAAP